MQDQTVRDAGRELTKLKTLTGALKSRLTRFTSFLHDPFNQTKKTEIRVRFTKIESILEEFESITQSIDTLTGIESNDYEEFEKIFYEVVSRAHDFMEKSNSTLVPQQSIAEVNSHNNPQLRLPRIELTTFNGAFDKWLSFINHFNSMVHENSSLSKIQKLYYLKSCLKEEAEEIISSLELTEENYEVALQLLKDRYDNKRVIIQKHVRALMDLPTIGKESALELRKFIDAMSMHLRALKALGQPIDTWDTLLIHSFTAKLDRVTHQEWEKSVTETEMPTMKDFTSFLEKRCQILQVTSINLANKSVPPAKLNNIKKQVFAVAQSSDGCAICKGSHKVYMCDSLKNLSVKDRFEKVKSSKLCFNCLKGGHSNSDCKWSGCKKCGKKHNTMLHYDANDFNTRNHNQTGNAQPEASTASFNGVAYKAYSALVSPQSVLSTAVINIKNQDGNLVKARVLLDNGAQSNFITEDLVKVLQLSRNHIDIPVETLNQIETRIKYSVRADINSRCTCYKETVEFLVLPNICNHLPYEYIDKRTIKVPLRKPLADPEFNKPQVIDALLGVELFFHLLCIGQERIPGSTALWQKTKLGWILAGKINSSTQSNKPRQCMLSFNALHKSLIKFWEIEEVQNQKFLSEEEHQVE
ncbi:uncharacterized protein LOC135168624 [Diachasmimorpha longicaudata]|uniref:uncharacterized protein LOC135168624 n=1 Tax=Diachasmimorpha longicaudata TaxID=58733 RepID=UPI0030B8B047